MIRGLSRIVPNVAVAAGLVLGLLLVPLAARPAWAEEKAPASASPESASESNAVTAPLVKGGLPADDPTAAVWNSAPQAKFPMSPQVHWPNRILDATVKDLSVRALHDGTKVAILLEYADPTEDADDAAAIEFMVGDKKAHFAHGQPMLQVEGGPVNIWFWRNKEAKGVDMNAMGFGTLKTQEHQDVQAKGVYSNGTWKVVFTRPLETGHLEEDSQIPMGGFIHYCLRRLGWQERRQRRGEGEGVPKGAFLLVEFPCRGAAQLFGLLLRGYCRGFGFRIPVFSDP